MRILLIASLLLRAAQTQAAELVINGSKLQGATSVAVDGTLYDVEFVDGNQVGSIIGQPGCATGQGCRPSSDLAQ